MMMLIVILLFAFSAGAEIVQLSSPPNTAPSIGIDLHNASVPAEQSITLTVLATGNPAPTYLWFFNGALLANSGASLTLNNCDVTNRGNYQIVATNSIGSATGAVAVLSVTVGTNTLYVNSVSGSDTNTGTTNYPLATIAMANSVSRVGKTNLLARGSVFREQCPIFTNEWVDCYGSNNYAAFGVYGATTNGKPIISGANLITNSAVTLRGGSTNTWVYSMAVVADTNTLANVTNRTVLMVWENNARLRAGVAGDGNLLWSSAPVYSAANATAIANVDLYPGSFYYDTNAAVLYFSTPDGSDPRANGKTYEASVRTLAVWGNDGGTARNFDAQKAYAYTGSGQQGYQVICKYGGTFQLFRASGGWNHVIGVANQQAASELRFTDGTVCDCDVGGGSGVHCIAYKDSVSGPPYPTVTFSNLLVYQTATSPGGIVSAFYSHGGTVAARVQSCVVTNVPTAFNGGDASVPEAIYEIRDCTAIDSSRIFGSLIDSGSISNVSAYGTVGTFQLLYSLGGTATKTNGFIDCKFTAANPFITLSLGAGTYAFTNCVFAIENQNAGFVTFQMGAATRLYMASNTFYKMGTIWNGAVANANLSTNLLYSDYNNFFTVADFAKNYPGTLATLANFTAQYPAFDAHSTQTDPGYAAGYFARPTVNDPAGP